ncbi:HAMP domain-containing methyl-accepting chemotaxis protein [Uliginosibacterium sediminicola]|uniref:HAMP domain-containing methyl-accepting chemotaxis protein n=1 Tax=Uliginosibacterium sediminicola TaxID=2024550 RepID=A0ABU9Z1K1_9RHOO
MFSRITIAQRVGLGFAFMLGLMIAVGVVGLVGLNRQYAEVKSLLARDLSLHLSMLEAQMRISKMRRDEKDVFLSVGMPAKVKEYRGKWGKSFDAVNDSLNTIRGKASDAERQKIADMDTQLKGYYAGMDEAVAKIDDGSYATANDVNMAFEPQKKLMQVALQSLTGVSVEVAKRVQKIDEELDSIRKQASSWSIVLILAGLALGAVAAWRIIVSIRRPLAQMQSTIMNISTTGHIGKRMPVEASDEIGETSRAVNHLLEGMSQIIGSANSNSTELLRAARELDKTAEKIAQASSSQSAAAESSAAAVQEMTSSVAQIADSARTLEQETADASVTAGAGAQTARRAAEEIQQVADSIGRSAEVMRMLDQRSGEIGEIVMVIKEIAAQTNLLALNAAIEAARAGEQGRGFAVVADEVRKLAERTTLATTQINDKIEAVQRDTGTAAQGMTHASEMVLKGVSCTQEVAAVLQNIEALARSTAHHIADIAGAIHEQSSASHAIAGHIERIASVSQENRESASAAQAHSSAVFGVAERLDSTIKRFTV